MSAHVLLNLLNELASSLKNSIIQEHDVRFYLSSDKFFEISFLT